MINSKIQTQIVLSNIKHLEMHLCLVFSCTAFLTPLGSWKFSPEI